MTDQYSSTGSVSNPGRIIGKVAKGALLAPIFAILGAAWIETAKAALGTTLTGPEKFGAVFAILSYTVVLAMFVAMTDLAFDELIDSIAGEN